MSCSSFSIKPPSSIVANKTKPLSKVLNTESCKQDNGNKESDYNGKTAAATNDSKEGVIHGKDGVTNGNIIHSPPNRETSFDD